MYFIVYLIEARKYAVIPCYWILDAADELWDKFVNPGLNSSQQYLCYWKSENHSTEYFGAPNGFFEPNFNTPLSSEFPVNEGTFYCRIVHFKGELMHFFRMRTTVFFVRLNFYHISVHLLFFFFVCSKIRQGCRILRSQTKQCYSRYLQSIACQTIADTDRGVRTNSRAGRRGSR